jgi:hypothetical protein
MERQELEALVTDDPNLHGIRKHVYKDITLFCSDNPPLTDIEKCTRGTIFNGDKCILRCLPFCNEIVIDDNANKIPDESEVAESKIYKAIEGTIIRLVYLDSEWMITTHRKINAYKSKWGNEKSFGDLFEQAILKTTKKKLPIFLQSLNTDYQYTFLLSTTKKTRLVCNCNLDIPDIYLYVITSECGTKYIEPNDQHAAIGVPQQPQLDIPVQSIIGYVKSVNPFECQGVMCLNTKNLQSIKFVNATYADYFNIRSPHIPSLPFAYLHTVNDLNKAFKFKQLCYPDELEILNSYDQKLVNISSSLKDLYIQRYFNGDHSMRTDPVKHNILKKIREHHIFLSHVVLDKLVYSTLINSDPVTLNKLIKQMNIESRNLPILSDYINIV